MFPGITFQILVSESAFREAQMKTLAFLAIIVTFGSMRLPVFGALNPI